MEATKTKSAMSRIWKKIANSFLFSCFRRTKRSTKQMPNSIADDTRTTSSAKTTTRNRHFEMRSRKRVTFRHHNDDDRASDRDFRLRSYRRDDVGHRNIDFYRPIWCYNCNEIGHVSRYCPFRNVERRFDSNGTWRSRCYYCNRTGHLTINCLENRYSGRKFSVDRNDYNSSAGRITARDRPHPATVEKSSEKKQVKEVAVPSKTLSQGDNVEKERVPTTETTTVSSSADPVNAENLKKNTSESPVKCIDAKDSANDNADSANVATSSNPDDGTSNGKIDGVNKLVPKRVTFNERDLQRDRPEFIIKYHRCNGVGHTKRNCFGAMVCFNCRETGHASHNCSQKTAERRPSNKCTGHCGNTCANCKTTVRFTRNYTDDRYGNRYFPAFNRNWNSFGRTTPGYCDNCGQRGHWSRECRKL